MTSVLSLKLSSAFPLHLDGKCRVDPQFPTVAIKGPPYLTSVSSLTSLQTLLLHSALATVVILFGPGDTPNLYSSQDKALHLLFQSGMLCLQIVT